MATWTRAALSSEAKRLAGTCWRAVEAQHVVSTMALVDTLEEQAVLEELINVSKPPVPPPCRGLHYLLSTPFRYGAAQPGGSRFRRAGLTPGVFYASLLTATAIAEMTFRRLLFYAESPATPWPVNAGEYTAFAVRFKTQKSLDLTRAPFDRQAAVWMDPVDYAPCQALAAAARDGGIQALRYRSARADGVNIALLTCTVFASRKPAQRQAWRIHVGEMGARAICAFPEQRLGFNRQAFARDPRIAAMRWQR